MMDNISLETLFPFGFSLKFQIFAFAIILYDKFVSKTIHRGSKRRSRIPESGSFFAFSQIRRNTSRKCFSKSCIILYLLGFYFLAFIGGIIGLYLGMQICRHKTSHQKRYFRRKVYTSAFLMPVLFKFCFNVQELGWILQLVRLSNSGVFIPFCIFL